MRRVYLLIVLVCFAVTAALGEGLPSSKATADVNTIVKCKVSTANPDGEVLPNGCNELYTGAPVVTDGKWIEIMSKPVKLSNSQSVFVSPSLVTGLYTQTRTKTVTGGTSTATAMGGVYLRAVLVPFGGGTPIPAAPLSACPPGIFGCIAPEANKWGVILDSRVQTLSQSLSACVIDVTSIAGTNDGSCTFTSTIELILKTTSAHTFNFIFPGVGQGSYDLKIYAALDSNAIVSATAPNGGAAVGAAIFGVGSVLVESVRLVHDFEL